MTGMGVAKQALSSFSFVAWRHVSHSFFLAGSGGISSSEKRKKEGEGEKENSYFGNDIDEEQLCIVEKGRREEGREEGRI